jgi:hypothetical protein
MGTGEFLAVGVPVVAGSRLFRSSGERWSEQPSPANEPRVLGVANGSTWMAGRADGRWGLYRAVVR